MRFLKKSYRLNNMRLGVELSLYKFAPYTELRLCVCLFRRIYIISIMGGPRQ